MFARIELMVRTLATQMRLRRLIRQHQEAVTRLAQAPADRALAPVLRGKLLAAMADVRAAWTADSAAAGELPALRRHVAQALSRMETSILRIRTGDGLGAPALDFQEAALPLLFCLRGLDAVPGVQLLGWLAPLGQTA